MFGLCMPTGEVYVVMKDGKKDSIMISDLIHPKKEIMQNKWILEYVQKHGYENIEAIVYERNNRKIIVSMAEYYYERAKELEG